MLKKILRNPKLRIAIQLTFTIVVLILLFNSINLSNLTQFLSSIKIWPLLFSLLITFLMRFLWAYQISITQAPMDMHFSVYAIFRIQMIATFYSLVLPGDLLAGGVSWYKLSQPERKYIEAGALLIFFRLVQISCLVFIGLIVALWDPQIGSPEFRTLIIFGLLSIILMWILFFSNQVTRIFDFIVNKVNGNASFLKSFYETVEKFLNTILKFRALGVKRLLFVFGLSLFAQFLGLVYFFSLARAVDIQLPFFVIGWISTFVTIIQMIPISIAGLGIREASYAVLLNEYGISPEQAISFSITIFAVFIIVGLVGGVFELSDIYRNWQRRQKPDTDRSNDISN
ncbi:MAG: flippase-like domain-containing protein [Anaerolineaceae bacterium]|nr:flippase-like domain-containing protein [Anaerolineaceae bacterium]